ncbi:MAG TPA: DUF1549 domain-containing protein, partial [Bacteroidia bacterium]|nr:DUF1549 domain-containing protein [Bacteroidia bacterium]
MKPLYLSALLVGLSLTTFSQAGSPSDGFDVATAAAKIDQLVEDMLAKQGQKPNADIDDATFLRRAYLDIVGRVPTIEEAEDFREADPAGRRSRLIAHLLGSEGHVSHAYHFWADILRVNSRL